MLGPRPRSTLFPYTTLFRSRRRPRARSWSLTVTCSIPRPLMRHLGPGLELGGDAAVRNRRRSEEHTSELQSLAYLVCRLLLEKKKQSQDQSSIRSISVITIT